MRKRNFVKRLVCLLCLGLIILGWVSNPKLVVVTSLIANRIPFYSPFASVEIENRLLTVWIDSKCNTVIYEEDLERVELIVNKVAKNRLVRDEIDEIRVFVLNRNGAESYEKVFPNIDISLTWNEAEEIRKFNEKYAPVSRPK